MFLQQQVQHKQWGVCGKAGQECAILVQFQLKDLLQKPQHILILIDLRIRDILNHLLSQIAS
ncbi:hypothetical protein D3C84_948210 [compost metagenome]